jgi:hypothetical protein
MVQKSSATIEAGIFKSKYLYRAYGRSREILTRREIIKKITMLQRRRYNCALTVA